MSETKIPITRGIHRHLAVDLFNHVWTLVKMEYRTRAQDDEMLHLAFAYEALARAAMVAEDEEEMLRYLELAREAGNKIAEEDDKQLFDADLATIRME